MKRYTLEWQGILSGKWRTFDTFRTLADAKKHAFRLIRDGHAAAVRVV